jgi:hypothetical protein
MQARWWSGYMFVLDTRKRRRIMVTQWVSRRPERGRYPTHRGASAPSIRTGTYAPAGARAPSARTEPLRSQRVGSVPSTRRGQPPTEGPHGIHQPGGFRPIDQNGESPGATRRLDQNGAPPRSHCARKILRPEQEDTQPRGLQELYRPEQTIDCNL